MQTVTESPVPQPNVSPLAGTKVPVVQVSCVNLKEVWPSLIHSIKYASFIAIDLVSEIYIG